MLFLPMRLSKTGGKIEIQVLSNNRLESSGTWEGMNFDGPDIYPFRIGKYGQADGSM